MTFDAAALERRIDAAAHQFGEQRRALVRADHSPLYAPAEQRAREQAASVAFRQELTRIGQAADAARDAATATLAETETADITAGFSTDELTRADVRSRLLAEDARDLPQDVVITRARLALDGGVRDERYTQLRVARSLLRGQDEREGVALRHVAAELAASLQDATKRDQAERTIADADRVSGTLGVVRYETERYTRLSRPVTTTR